MKLIKESEMRSIIISICENVGLSKNDSAVVSDALVEANLRGVDTHGIRTLPVYIKRFEHGSLNKKPVVEIDRETNIAASVNGDNGLGHIIGEKSMLIAIEKAKKFGIGLVTARNSNHFGATAYFSMKALKNNYIGIAMTNATARLAPTGGITPCYGNNPWSMAIPTGDIPIVSDMAMSVVANSNIIIAREKGTQIPYGWALTKDGEPTQDPNLAELLLPFGAYKGYAIAIINEILSGVL
ncbi:MAG: Ldh family oxidoreductase [Sedimentibacter sp.]